MTLRITKSNNTSAVGNLVKSRRIQLGMQAKELASKIGSVPQNISHCENGKQGFTLTQIVRLSDALSIDLDDLLDAVVEDFNTKLMTKIARIKAIEKLKGDRT